ncbi:MAG: hypothetical protein JW821_08275 [Deltaproteobacteria bacterium]|nr:hypothetical protein [Deltaproteobacteria bacterium]
MIFRREAGRRVVETMPDERNTKEGRALHYSRGRLYFTKGTERAFFFFLTIIMLLWGVLEMCWGAAG